MAVRSEKNMIAFFFVSLLVVSLWATAIALRSLNGEISIGFLSLSLFGSINLLICFWEIVLYFYADRIKMLYLNKKKKLPKGQLGSIFLFNDAPLSLLLSPSYWSEVWATYSLVDPSYSDTTTFGWNIDVGNGFSTIIPMILFYLSLAQNSSISFGSYNLDVSLVGLIGFVSFYQMLYGTIVYFHQYYVNQYWVKFQTTLIQFLLLVLCPNIIWIVGPSYGMYISYHMIFSSIFLC